MAETTEEGVSKTNPTTQGLTTPYVRGMRIQVRQHDPLVGGFEKTPLDGGDKMTVQEILAARPMRSGSRGTYGAEATLEVVEPIRTAVYQRAQIVLCTLDTSDPESPTAGCAPGTLYVAKIFDPLLYGCHPSYEPDFATTADVEYSTEAEAYLTLRDKVGALIPRFYGCWTCRLPWHCYDDDDDDGDGEGPTTPSPSPSPSDTTSPPVVVVRDARIVLMEHVRMPLLRGLNRYAYPPASRAEILARVIEAAALVAHHGVYLRDLAPRNVFVSTPDITSPDFRVVLFDFGDADFRADGQPVPQLPPESPAELVYYFGGGWDGLEQGWLPRPSSFRRGLREWAFERWKGSPRYRPYTDGYVESMESDRQRKEKIHKEFEEEQRERMEQKERAEKKRKLEEEEEEKEQKEGE